MPNRLASETSPYLLQHKDNPVDWYPWGSEAFEKAQTEDKPIFLSVGYSSCHWCHVMEHESFVSPEVAALLNEHFVSVKVDREERPDVDEAYMTAVQLASGRGGWPMSLFLTPDRRPFFAATYLPKEDHPQSAGFLTVLSQIERAWKEERVRIEDIAAQYDGAIRASVAREAPEMEAILNLEMIDQLAIALSMDFDEEQGGFGGAPKFPPHTAIEFLLDYAYTEDLPPDFTKSGATMAFFTLQQMALGGIHDHVGGGFHRYSTDGQWLLPHFEKMLYDNALLLRNYARASHPLSDPPDVMRDLFFRVIDGIVGWVKREMTTSEGLFCSALDADSEGEEGKYYVWSAQEIDEVLGARSAAFKKAFQIAEKGNFRDEATGIATGYNIPHLFENVEGEYKADLELLRARREKRVKPGLDYKIIVGWNGLMIGGLADAGEIELAQRAAAAILDYEKEYGSLPHQIVAQRPSGDGFLEDYAYFIDGLRRIEVAREDYAEALKASPPEAKYDWVEEVIRLIPIMIEKFYDEARGGFFSTSDRHEELFGRTKPVFDQPLPSANAVAFGCLLAIRDEARAKQSMNAFLNWMARAPTATEALHRVGLSYITRFMPNMEERREWERTHVRPSLASFTLHSTDGKAPGSVILDIPEGYHVQSVKVEIDAPFTIEVFYPAERYEGRAEIPFRVLNQNGKLRFLVTFQTCTDSECQPPETHVLEATLRST